MINTKYALINLIKIYQNCGAPEALPAIYSSTAANLSYKCVFNFPKISSYLSYSVLSLKYLTDNSWHLALVAAKLS